MCLNPSIMRQGIGSGKSKQLIIIVAVICLLIGFSIGYTAGVTMTLNWVAGKISHFVDIDEDALAHAIWQWKNHIDKCYPTTL